MRTTPLCISLRIESSNKWRLHGKNKSVIWSSRIYLLSIHMCLTRYNAPKTHDQMMKLWSLCNAIHTNGKKYTKFQQQKKAKKQQPLKCSTSSMRSSDSSRWFSSHFGHGTIVAVCVHAYVFIQIIFLSFTADFPKSSTTSSWTLCKVHIKSVSNKHGTSAEPAVRRNNQINPMLFDASVCNLVAWSIVRSIDRTNDQLLCTLNRVWSSTYDIDF